MMLTNGVVNKTIFNNVNTPLLLSASSVNTLHANIASSTVYAMTILFLRMSNRMYLSILLNKIMLQDMGDGFGNAVRLCFTFQYRYRHGKTDRSVLHEDNMRNQIIQLA